jgi:molybdate transport system substrate-binding protein
VRTTRAGVAAALALALAGCGGGDGALQVLASASLAEAFGAAAAAFERGPGGGDVELQLAGTPVLVEQIARGAPAGVFASADEENMARVVALGGTAGSPRAFATNALELVVARGNPEGVTGLVDLARSELVVALAAEEVPAGRYARRALARAGVDARPDTLEPSVRAIVNKVALGEVDVGVVYRTDVPAAGTRVDGVAIPAAHNVDAVLTVVALEAGGAPADAFIAFLLSGEGRRILAAAGFGPPPEAAR